MSRICRAYGAIHVEVFAIPSVIIASIRMADGEYSSETRRVYGSENNLSKVEAYSDISYNVCKNRPPLEELDEMIRKQKRKKQCLLLLFFLDICFHRAALPYSSEAVCATE